MDFPDVESLRFQHQLGYSTSETGSNSQKPQTKRNCGQFIKGPIPKNWVAAACSLGGSASQVAWVLWFQAGRKKTATVVLSSKLLASFSISRNSYYRAIQLMEQAGLIEATKRSGKSPLITILPRCSPPECPAF